MDIKPSHDDFSTPKHIYDYDIEIEVAIKELLHNSQQLDASDITVIVDNCNVKLCGTVPGQEDRDYALSIVKLVQGVGEIHSELIVIGRNPH